MSRPSRLAAFALCLLLLPGCGWLKRLAYEGSGRDGWQQPERVLAALALEPGERVADLGAGGGYFTFRLAEAVGPAGRVFAIDVDPDMIAYLDERIRDEGVANVETVLAEPDDPKLPADGVDWIFTCNTYHHLEQRAAYFARARRGLRPGGRVAVLDLRPHGLFQRIFPHATEADTVEAEMRAAGFHLAARHDFLERQSFLVFEPEAASP
jgi:ubiquinone/menaquinone biosynthesis C-methylase UbiE